jgi:hypothetical protein
MCGLVWVLWVRSYWCQDSIAYHPRKVAGDTDKFVIEVVSQGGQIEFRRFPGRRNSTPNWDFESWPTDARHSLGYEASFRWQHANKFFLEIWIPYWSIIAVAIPAVAALWWIPWSNRFSLRTLLIAITFVAFLFGVIVLLTR